MTLRDPSSTLVQASQEFSATIQYKQSTELYPALHSPGETGLPLLVIENPLGRAVIALQGAHLLSFQPTGQRDVLWLSPKCKLQSGTAIRGGIPLCLPWFGAGPDGKSAHGFARTAKWSVVAAEKTEAGATRVVLELAGDASTCTLWPHKFCFQLEFVVGDSLKMSLSAQNRSLSAAPYAFAFHTYFSVPEVAKSHVTGLENTTFIDKINGSARKAQEGNVTITEATDRIYLDVPTRQTLESAADTILIDSDARCAVVWNAWNNDRNIADMGEGNHVGYLCVERGEIADRALTLQPGETHCAWMTLSF